MAGADGTANKSIYTAEPNGITCRSEQTKKKHGSWMEEYRSYVEFKNHVLRKENSANTGIDAMSTRCKDRVVQVTHV
ncbi:hypothetical protein T265_11876 [Opisthorchis viverrini]|uniref:Uncharacterized protein n=1 Tax=Opisthorchis viverrini TaxID=6198 RepID=A0A074YXC7_OPIVI|nr:hypothetical protein T265_11876 [Opisthorchis viverrini]KER19308.1 hypothetical protein T265_11876 [Opisthorchis viverrini]